MAKWQVGYGWGSALQGSKGAGFCLAGWTLVACGEPTREPDDSLMPPAGQPAAVGGATSAGAGAGATGAAGAGSGAGGSAGAPVDPGPPADIAGRWAMFSFE